LVFPWLAKFPCSDLARSAIHHVIHQLALNQYLISSEDEHALETAIAEQYQDDPSYSLLADLIELASGVECSRFSFTFLIVSQRGIHLLVQALMNNVFFEFVLDFLYGVCTYSLGNWTIMNDAGIDITLLSYLNKKRNNDELASSIVKLLNRISSFATSHLFVDCFLAWRQISPLFYPGFADFLSINA
jgi:hypothetical protein